LGDEVTIRELLGPDEMFSIFPVFRQGNSHLGETAFRERLSAMAASGNYRCIAAYVGDRMVGVSGFWIGTQLWCGKYLEADHVVVDKDLRSTGIGAKMMAWVEAEGERIGCNVFRIAMVLGRERTRQFYQRNGFFDDGLIMVKALSRGATEFPEYVPEPVEPA
jgi:GNAT superfamily N-acetyltransferase